MRRFFRCAAVPVLLALLLSLCGCSASGGIDQYFSLPQPAEEYLQLQQLIDQEIAAGSEYAAPVRGSYRQSVQLTDLDGDGIDEALVFLRDANRNLKINIYYAVGKEYRQVLSVEGEGRAIGSIDFADMDCDGHTDLLVAWQIAAGMNLLSVYSLRNWTGELLLSTDSSEFITGDLNSDGQEELLVIRGGTPGMYLADMYTLNSDREPQATSAALSSGIYELRRLRTVRAGMLRRCADPGRNRHGRNAGDGGDHDGCSVFRSVGRRRDIFRRGVHAANRLPRSGAEAVP